MMGLLSGAARQQRSKVTNLFDPKIMRGMLYGFLAGLVVGVIVNAAGVAYSPLRAAFWGAVVGGFAVYWPRFANLGAVITRRPLEHQRNMIVGILALVVFAAFLLLVMIGGGTLLVKCFPSLE